MRLLNRIKYKLRTANFPELPEALKGELIEKGWLKLLAEAATLLTLFVVGYLALVVTAIYMQGVPV